MRISTLWRNPHIATAASLALLLAAATCSSDVMDPHELADALASDMSAEMTFKNSNGEETPPTDGAPPESTVDAPKIVYAGVMGGGSAFGDQGLTGMTAYGTEFTIMLNADRDLTGANVTGIIAHVAQTNRDDAAAHYYRIEPVAVLGFTVEILATVNYAPGLGGNSFEVRFAFVSNDVQIAPYYNWTFITYPQGANLDNSENTCKCSEAHWRTAHDESTCRDSLQSIEETMRTEIVGWLDTKDDPDTVCEMMHSVASDFAGEFDYPTGGWFEFYWIDEEARQACEIEIVCQ
ncbi:MAG: hypothetical protein JXR96_26085 [Deltaproteobacteria bacterium]|nr:hypothetical protein [Deltaproteobacteria bacterium]